MTGAGSVAGTKAANGATADMSQAILNNMRAHGIDLGLLVRESFEKRIKREGLFTIVPDGEKADADVELTISQWGLCLKNFSTVLYPVIGVNGSMKRNGTSVWRNFNTISVFNEANTVAFTPQQYATNREALRAVFSHVTDLAVGKLMENLKQ